MTQQPTARDLARQSQAAVQAKDRQAWLSLFAADAIVQDFAGRRTYDTCYRAKYIFGLDEAVLVTQAYHLPRAIFTCNALGIQSSGVKADLRTYSPASQVAWNIRELPASLVALWDVWVSHPLPVMGEPEPIFADDE